ncbi:MAG: prefoldin subunit alpha [Nanoarchaeota archaeon]|mgnify:CR=1 FL=1
MENKVIESKKPKEQREITPELQRSILELSIISEEVKRLEQQLLLIESQGATFSQLYSDLEEVLKNKDAEILTNFGSGVFVRAKLTDNKKVLVNIGSRVVVEKSIEEARDIIEKQMNSMEELKNEIRTELLKNIGVLEKLERDIRG